MDEFPGLLHRDFGLRPQGKAAPMSAAKTGIGSSERFGSGAGGSVLAGDLFGGDLQSSRRAQRDEDDFFGVGGAAAPKYSSASRAFGSDPFFGMGAKPGPSPSVEATSSPSMPVFDKPVYDDEEDIFSGVPGLTKGATANSDVFASPAYGDDLLAGLGGSRVGGSGANGAARSTTNNGPFRSDEDILSGFGDSGPRKKSDAASNRVTPSFDDDLLASLGGGKAYMQNRRPGSTTNHSPPSYEDDLLAGLGGVSSHSGKETRSQKKETVSGFDDLIPGFGGISIPSQKSGKPEIKQKSSVSSLKSTATVAEDPFVDLVSTSTKKSDVSSEKVNEPFDDIGGFDGLMKPKASFSSQMGNNQRESSSKASNSSSEPSRYVHKNDNSNSDDANNLRKPEESSVGDDDLWFTVSDIQLFTPLTSAPPPSRPPPPAIFRPKEARGQKGGTRRMANDNFAPQSPPVNTWDDLDEFSMAKPTSYGSEDEGERNSAADAMKEAMDKAEAKFKHAREVRERERDLKSFRNREAREECEKEKERLDQERDQKEREKEMEQQRLEKVREMELERERARRAVERATREARERAAADARQKAERASREQAERAAVQRAQAEARERAALEAKERAEKLAAERERAAVDARERAAAEAEAREKASRERAAREKAAVDRAASEARARAQRAAVERVTAEARERAAAEARERAAAEARERAAAAAREKQQKSSDNDLDSFFGMGNRATSAPKERSTTSGPAFDAQFPSTGTSVRGQRSSGVPSGMRRPSSTTNMMDDLTSVFSGKSSDEFQEIEGESEERRRARLEREQRTRQRTAKALAEKNERELQVQREQAERDRISDTLNVEIKRWSAGKEGNLRALLSTLQYVLWPDSGWQPVSLTDLITGASVKKVYRKATLCVHPDKVVSGTVQQKYIAEKVFDLLKEAWNKFNSEELF